MLMCCLAVVYLRSRHPDPHIHALLEFRFPPSFPCVLRQGPSTQATRHYRLKPFTSEGLDVLALPSHFRY